MISAFLKLFCVGSASRASACDAHVFRVELGRGELKLGSRGQGQIQGAFVALAVAKTLSLLPPEMPKVVMKTFMSMTKYNRYVAMCCQKETLRNASRS